MLEDQKGGVKGEKLKGADRKRCWRSKQQEVLNDQKGEGAGAVDRRRCRRRKL